MSGRSHNQFTIADEKKQLRFESHRCIKVQSESVKKVNSLDNIEKSLGMQFYIKCCLVALICFLFF
jgi:hypothetical protein